MKPLILQRLCASKNRVATWPHTGASRRAPVVGIAGTALG